MLYDSDNENTDFDTEWINEFEKVDKNYDIFYKEDLQYIKITILYVNKFNEIDKIKEEKIFLKSKNVISKEEIIEILIKNKIQKNTKYSMMTMLKYNFDLDPIEIRGFLLDQSVDFTYLSVINNIDDIKLEKTISMFQDLNNLFIIFYENADKDKSKIITSNKTRNHKHKNNNKTKKNLMTLQRL